MATSLLVLLDDIATTLDDIAVLSKVAAKKTAGVLGDDLALNAQQLTGLSADRELPIVWQVTKGSIVNKLILVPVALVISQFAPWLVSPLLMVGGLFLCFEGFEKVFEKLFHKKADGPSREERESAELLKTNPREYEKQKVKGAIRTDFILSAEIVVIALGTVAEASLTQRILVMFAISLLMTVGVYGFVAIIVKIDDLGLYLLKEKFSSSMKSIGRGLLVFAPMLMKFLGVVGTAAMFLVGGGILVHGIQPLHHISERFNTIGSSAISLATGLVAGGLVVAVVHLAQKMRTAKG